MVRALKIFVILIINIVYTLLAEVYWLYYYGVTGASGVIVLVGSSQKIILNLIPVFVALAATVGVFLNILWFKKTRKKGNKEIKWLVVLIISIVMLSLPAISGLSTFVEYLIRGDEMWM